MGCTCSKKPKEQKKEKPYAPPKKPGKDEKPKKPVSPKPGEKPSKASEKQKAKEEKKKSVAAAKAPEKASPLVGIGLSTALDDILIRAKYPLNRLADAFCQTELTNPRAIHMCTCDCVSDAQFRYDIEPIGFMELCKARLLLHPPERGCTVLSLNSDPAIAAILAILFMILAHYLPAVVALVYSVALVGAFFAL